MQASVILYNTWVCDSGKNLCSLNLKQKVTQPFVLKTELVLFRRSSTSSSNMNVVLHLHFEFIKFHDVSINMQMKLNAFHIPDTSLLLDSIATLHEKQNYNTFTFVRLSSCFTSLQQCLTRNRKTINNTLMLIPLSRSIEGTR